MNWKKWDRKVEKQSARYRAWADANPEDAEAKFKEGLVELTDEESAEHLLQLYGRDLYVRTVVQEERDGKAKFCACCLIPGLQQLAAKQNRLKRQSMGPWHGVVRFSDIKVFVEGPGVRKCARSRRLVHGVLNWMQEHGFVKMQGKRPVWQFLDAK